MLYQRGANMGSNMGSRMHSYPLYQDFQQKAEPLSQVLCRRLVPVSVSVNNQTERVEAELVSGNYFSMLGVKPAVGRVFNSREDDQVYKGHPVVVLSYGYWVSRFARDPGVVGKTIRVNDYPMTIVGVSAEGFAGLDPTPLAADPRAGPDAARADARVRPGCTWTTAGPAGCRCSAGSSRATPCDSAQAPLQGLFTQIRDYETTLPARKGLVRLRRDQFMKGQLIVEAAAAVGYSPLRNDFSDGARRADVHGGPGAADRLRATSPTCSSPRLHAAEGDRGALVARLVARPPGAPAPGREPAALRRGRRARTSASRSPSRAACWRWCLRRASRCSSRPQPGSARPRVHVRPRCGTGIVFGLLPALRASRPDPWTTLKDTTGAVAAHRAGRCCCGKALSSRRWHSASCCSSAPDCSSGACRT